MGRSKRLNRQSNEDVLDAMTQYGLRSQELCQSEDEQEQQDSLRVIASGDHVAGDDLDKRETTRSLERS